MATASKKRAGMMKQSRFSELFSVIDTIDDDEVFLFDDNHMGVFFIMQPTPGSNDTTRIALENFYKESYPKNTSIQWALASSPDIEDSLWGYNQIRGGRIKGEDRERGDLMAKLSHDFVKNGTLNDINDAGYIFRNYEIWLTIKVKIRRAVPEDIELRAFKKQMRNIRASLDVFAPRFASKFDYKRRMNVFLNMYDGYEKKSKPDPSKKTDGSNPDENSIGSLDSGISEPYTCNSDWKGVPQHQDKSQVNDELRGMFLERGRSVSQEPEGVQIYNEEGDPCQYIRSMSIRKFPDQMYYGNMINLIGSWLDGNITLNEHYILVLNVFYPDQKKAKKAFNAKRLFIDKQSVGSAIRILDKLRFQKNDYAIVNREIEQENSQIISYSMQVLSFCKNKTDSEDFFQKLRGVYDKLKFKLHTDTEFSLPFVLAGLPFGLDEDFVNVSYRFSHATTKGMVYITPHMGSWKGNTNHPVMMLGDRMGQMVGLDFFKTDSNYNIYCAATSGAGKSFFVGTLVNAMLGSGVKNRRDHLSKNLNDGAQIFIVDVGRSYQKLAAMYNDSRFLEFGGNAKYSMNPFACVENLEEDNQANMIRSLIKVMASPSGQVSDVQNSLLLEIIQEAWDEKGKGASVTDIQQKCLNHEITEMRDIGLQLKPFATRGIYEDYFSNKYPPLEFKSRLIVCELEELKGDPHLQVIILMCLVMGIQKEMYLQFHKGDNRRRIFVLDEAWEFIKDNREKPMLTFFGDFIETGWRRFRKYGASGCLATQSVNDASQSPVGEAVMANSAWTCLLRQNPDEVEKLKNNKKLSGGDNVIQLLKSIRTKTPNPSITDEAYSEILIRYGEVAHPCRLYTSREIQLINTTNADERALLSEFTDKGFTLENAIQGVIKRERESKV
jgi:conjugal transfer ATP-binding protein TraC